MTDIFLFYFEKSWNEFKRLPLKKQLLIASKLLKQHKIGVMDFCGMSNRFLNVLPATSDIFMMDNAFERINIEDYSLIIVMIYSGQNIYIDYPCIEMVFSRGVLIE